MVAIVYVYRLSHTNQRIKERRRTSVYNCRMYSGRLKRLVNDVEFGGPSSGSSESDRVSTFKAPVLSLMLHSVSASFSTLLLAVHYISNLVTSWLPLAPMTPFSKSSRESTFASEP